MSTGYYIIKNRKLKDADKTTMTRLQKYFKRADKDKDGEISVDDWMEVLAKSGVEVERSDVEEMFKENDKDLDGKLSWKEFIGEKTKIEVAFATLDLNSDGKISKEEFSKLAHNLSDEQVAAAIKKFDVSKDGKKEEEFIRKWKEKK